MLQGSALRKKPCSRKVDKCDTVFPHYPSGVPIIGARWPGVTRMIESNGMPTHFFEQAMQRGLIDHLSIPPCNWPNSWWLTLPSFVASQVRGVGAAFARIIVEDATN